MKLLTTLRFIVIAALLTILLNASVPSNAGPYPAQFWNGGAVLQQDTSGDIVWSMAFNFKPECTGGQNESLTATATIYHIAMSKIELYKNGALVLTNTSTAPTGMSGNVTSLIYNTGWNEIGTTGTLGTCYVWNGTSINVSQQLIYGWAFGSGSQPITTWINANIAGSTTWDTAKFYVTWTVDQDMTADVDGYLAYTWTNNVSSCIAYYGQ